MLEFPPSFVQKIFCFVQIPESFVQKHETTAGETEGNTKEIFLDTANSAVWNRKMMKYYAKKGKTSSSAGNYYEIQAKKQKQAHLNRTVKGWFHHFRHFLKKKTPVFALHTLHRSYRHCSYPR